INRSTFYNHYGSQFDVLREMEMDMVRDLEEMWEDLYTTDSSTISRRAEMLCTYIMENKELTKLVFSNSETTSEFAALLFGSGRLKSIYDIIFSDEPDIYKKELMKTYYSCGSYHMLRQWILDDFPVSPKELGEIICSMANIYSDTSRKNTAGE
ncbi:MAG: TetR/AcrR family transcriptional regulator, partial [Oscillospiraceae bacterium]